MEMCVCVCVCVRGEGGGGREVVCVAHYGVWLTFL